MKVKLFILIIFISLISITLFAQKSIPLKEVNVFPPGYIKEVLKKVNNSLATNYEIKKYFKYNLESEAKINNNQILEQLNTVESIKTNPLVFAYYFSKRRLEPEIIDSSFYNLHYLEDRLSWKFFRVEMITALGLDKKGFLEYKDSNEYSIKRIEDVITLEFKSTYYCGTMTLNANNFNLISLDYYNDKSFNVSTRNFNIPGRNDMKTIASSSNYINCAIRYKSLKNNKFVIDNMNFDVEYQDYTINNLKDKNIKFTVFKKINSKVQMRMI